MFNRLISSLFLCVIHIAAAQAQCPAAVPPSITNVAVTESRCQASGTATVTATGGTAPYTYSITIGPVLVPAQSVNIIQSLAAGNYTVQVRDACNTTVTANFTIAGTYQVPLLTGTPQSPTCPGGNDGTLTLQTTRGRPAYSYSLIAPSPLTAGPQASNVFTGLTAGTYACRVTDSCGNYQTRNITLLDGDDGAFEVSYSTMTWVACDSFYIDYLVQPSYNLKFPYTAVFTAPDGSTVTHTLTAANIRPGYSFVTDTFRFRFHHITGNPDFFTINVTNRCNYSVKNYYFMSVLDMYASPQFIEDCSKQYSYTFDYLKDNNPANTYDYKLHCNPVTYKLVNAAGTVLATQVNNSFFTGFPANQNYKVIREDCCSKDSLVFTWAEVPPLKITSYFTHPENVYKEGTTGIYIITNNITTGNIIVASGPPAVTFMDGTVHHYTYPDTVKNLPLGTTNVGINYFTAGTYKFYVMDTCGQKDSIDITVTPAELRHSTFSSRLVKGCTGANKIIWHATTNNSSNYFYNALLDITGGTSFQRYVALINDTDSLINQSSGNYYLRYQYREYYVSNSLKGMDHLAPDVIFDTIVISPYTQPYFAATPAIASCGTNRSAAVLPDSTRGVPPYTYQITSGLVTRPMQASPVFNNLPQGTYTFLQADACGNSYSTNLTVDTLSVPGIAASGDACPGGAATYRLPNNPYYSYVWQRPNGSTSSGDSLVVSPVTAADTGTYKITVTSNTGSCIDTKQRSFRLNFCSLLPLQLLTFTATAREATTLLKWQTAEEVNTSYFIIERSSNGTHFTALQMLPATGRKMNGYNAVDAQPFAGTSYYRLKMADKDGHFTYSRIVTVENTKGSLITVTPTLINGSAAAWLHHPRPGTNATVQLISADGKVVASQKVLPASLQTSLPVQQLAKGIYSVVFINNGTRQVTRMVRQ